uniref:Uncharacterized protein n=1 Tax=Arundo donax TaxID=35708 RepID=A0A0A9F9F7_ARUDO
MMIHIAVPATISSWSFLSEGMVRGIMHHKI